MNIDFPFHIDNRQRTAVTSDNDHIRDLIEQLVLTGPGERVNRPDFGGGLQQLVFAGNSPELAATVQFMIQGNLQQYLGDLIDVASVQVDAVDSALQVVVAYVVRRTGERQTAGFSSSLGQR
jgi:phage baseplate assembly protein W